MHLALMIHCLLAIFPTRALAQASEAFEVSIAGNATISLQIDFFTGAIALG